MLLVKYLAHAGLCSRRASEKLIKSGQIQINGKFLDQPGYDVKEGDKVTHNGKLVQIQPGAEKIYLILNKPAGLITTASDEQGRETVVSYLQKRGIEERVFPIGRLDKDTTGLLILTNDGDFAYKMSHPKFEVRKTYIAKLDKKINLQDLKRLQNGLKLDDGFIKPDKLQTLTASTVEISLHSGKNRIVRRIFKFLGYQVTNLHRTSFGPLTLLGIKAGEWKKLSLKKIGALNTQSPS